MTDTNKRPWLTKNGQPKAEATLKRECQNWSKEEWEDYLKSTENPQTELLVDDHAGLVEQRANEIPDFWQDLSPPGPTPYLDDFFAATIEQLSVKEQQAIDLIYYQSLSYREAAFVMGCHRRTVASYCERAHKKIFDQFMRRFARAGKHKAQ